MSANSLFLSNVVTVFPTNSPDPFFANYLDALNELTRYNVKLKQITSFNLAAAETKVFTLPNQVLADWQCLFVKVAGSVTVDTTARDTDSVTAIAGHVPVYGTSLFPGILQWSTYNLVTLTLTAVTASTGEIFVAVCEED